MYQLSVCIPTYNREPLLRLLLDNLLKQRSIDHVQIVVSDNASTDNTTEMVRSFQQDHNNVKYLRSETNRGPDANYLRAVDGSDANYCWLFGSDDLPQPGIIEIMLEIVATDAFDIMLFPRIWCDYRMNPLRVDELFSNGDFVLDTGSERELVAYFDRATSIMALFSYLSSIVVSRKRWIDAGTVDQYIGTAYVHSAKLFQIMRQVAKIAYFSNPCVLCRGDNDHFMQHGFYHRARIDFAGFERLIDDYFPEKLVNDAAKGVVRREYTLLRLLQVAALSEQNEVQELLTYVKKYHYDKPTLKVISKARNPLVRFLMKSALPFGKSVWWMQAKLRHKSKILEAFERNTSN